MFNPNTCTIPKTWCGKGTLPKGYAKIGSRSECLQIGFGAGIHSEKAKSLPTTSLRQIKYIGEKYETRFKKKNITTTNDLLKFVTKNNKTTIQKLLVYVFTRTSSGLDKRGYNSTMIYLYSHGIASAKIPICYKI